LEIRCPHCNSTNRAGAKYCNGCAANLTRAGFPQQSAGTGRLDNGLFLNGRYMVLSKFAQGGMSAVYKVNDSRQPGTVWALKEMSLENLEQDEVAEAVEAFHQEADLLQKLSHPNLVTVNERFSDKGKEYLVMEYIQGETLDNKVGLTTLPEAEVLQIAFQLCDILGYLHGQKPPIIYRDLKPSNIMVETASGLLKLIDFGIVRFYKPGKRKDTKLLGTPGFAPPEQWGQEQTDARSDIFALGVTLLVLLTSYDVSQNPWEYPLARRLNAHISEQMEAVIAKAVQLQVKDRYQSVQELRDALLQCNDARQILATLPSTKLGQLPAPRPKAAGLRQSAGNAVQAGQNNNRSMSPPVQPGSAGGGRQNSAPAAVMASNVIPPHGALPEFPPPGLMPQAQTNQPGGLSTGTTSLHITPATLHLSGTVHRKITGQLSVSNANGHALQGSISSSAPWLVAQPEQFNADSVTVDITVQTSQVTLPKAPITPPPLLLQAWQWAVRHGAHTKPWTRVDTWRSTLLFGVPALLGGGLAYAVVWLVYWHLNRWRLGAAEHQELLTIYAGNGVASIPVQVDLVPALYQMVGAWCAAVSAVIGEIVLLVALLTIVART